MKTGERIPGGLTIIVILIVLIVCVLVGVAGARWLDFNLSDFFHLREKETLLTLADYKSGQSSPTPFLPAATENSLFVLSDPTPTATNIILPTTTTTPTPTEISIPASHYIDGVYGMAQMTTLDCEMRSAVDWARSLGVSIDETEFILKLPHSNDPELGFVGEIDGEMGQLPPDGYGVYPPPIASILREYGLNAQPIKNMTYEDLQREIANDRPVIVWIVNLPFEIDQTIYTASNGNTVPVARFEHTWIVTGYNLSTVTVVDSTWTYNVVLETFLERWAVLENRAIILQE
ncbi:MAG: C39 family peptidase [Anaerolineaceae bacterium]